MKTKTTRTRNGHVEYLYGGYVTWPRRDGSVDCREVRVWGPPEWDPDRYGDGSDIMEAVTAKARKRWPSAECNECWRY